jgi:hypothetical protein
MTQRAQEQRIHDNPPSKLRKHLDQKQRRNVGEVTPSEDGELRRITEGEECNRTRGKQESALGNRHSELLPGAMGVRMDNYE